MHGSRLLLAVLAGAAVMGLSLAPAASAKPKAKKPKPPTQLYYRVKMTYTGESSRTYPTNTGPVVNKGSWRWLMENPFPVLVTRGAGARPDISFSARMDGELIEHCRAQLARVKCPRSIDFRAELPRTPTGKLLKRLLKDEYASAARA